jgi:hypothetical protein
MLPRKLRVIEVESCITSCPSKPIKSCILVNVQTREVAIYGDPSTYVWQLLVRENMLLWSHLHRHLLASLWNRVTGFDDRYIIKAVSELQYNNQRPNHCERMEQQFRYWEAHEVYFSTDRSNRRTLRSEASRSTTCPPLIWQPKGLQVVNCHVLAGWNLDMQLLYTYCRFRHPYSHVLHLDYRWCDKELSQTVLYYPSSNYG